MNRFLIQIFLVLFGFSRLGGQENNIGVPFIQNYSKKTYGAGTQNWEIIQDEKGIIYVANNEGLLSFNGKEWNRHPLPNKTILRSTTLGEDGKIYVGGQDEFGCFVPDQSGRLNFLSLKDRLPTGQDQFEDVWDLAYDKANGVFFRASDKIYHLGDSGSVYNPGNPILFLGKIGDQIIIQEESIGLKYYQEGVFQMLPGADFLKKSTIRTILPYAENSFLIATFNDGLFLYDGKSLKPFSIATSDFLREKRIEAAVLLPNGNIVIGTLQGGLLIMNPNGLPLQWITKEDGLQNNAIRSLFADRQGDLWLGLNNGIDFITTSSPFSIFYPDGFLEGASYTAQKHQEQIYFGTSNGLYKTQWKDYYNPFSEKKNFQPIPGTGGQVWGIDVIENDLLLGHGEGAFSVQGNGVQRLSPGIGNWLFKPVGEDGKFMISGTYFGLTLFEKKADGWDYIGLLEGFNESSRFIVPAEKNHLWVSHPYRGIFKVNIEAETAKMSVQQYSTAQGLPSNFFNYITKINEEIIVCAEKGVFHYDKNSDRFIVHEAFNRLFGVDTKVRRLIEGWDKNIWFVSEKEVGVLLVNDKGIKKEIQKVSYPELKNKLLGGFEFIYPIDEQNVFFGSEKGMIHFNPEKAAKRKTFFHTLISKVHLTANTDSLILSGYKNPDSLNLTRNALLKYKQNALRFDFTATYFDELHQIEFQNKLDGLNDEWSEWSTKSDKEFTNLPPGSYTFRVRSRISNLIPGSEISYNFKILPPWYATRIAYTSYVFVILTFLLGLILIPQRRFKRERALLASEHQKSVEAHQEVVKLSEQKLVKVKNEKLEAEVTHKNQELASMTMHLVQKNELLHKMAGELKKISQQSAETPTRKAITKLVHLLKEDTQLDKDWEQFAYHFDQVHGEFFKRLRERFPNLTPKDHKLCAYLRMNLSTKEIAPLLNISVRGVEISRYRLRKKLDLGNDINLTDFMMNF